MLSSWMKCPLMWHTSRCVVMGKRTSEILFDRRRCIPQANIYKIYWVKLWRFCLYSSFLSRLLCLFWLIIEQSTATCWSKKKKKKLLLFLMFCILNYSCKWNIKKELESSTMKTLRTSLWPSLYSPSPQQKQIKVLLKSTQFLKHTVATLEKFNMDYGGQRTE